MLFIKSPLPSRFFVSTAVIILCAVCLFIYHIHSLDERRNIALQGASISQTSDIKPTLTSSPSTSEKALPPSPRIPPNLWYKLTPKGLTPQVKQWTQTCITKNPSFTTHFMTDISADAYVKQHFSHRPDIVTTYLSLSIPILKADLLRYLLLLTEGGVWNDLDITCGDTPIHNWIPEQYKAKTNLVVGWEFDVGWGDNIIREFASWTMLASPGNVHIETIISDILDSIHDRVAEYNVSDPSQLTRSMVGDVVDFTGPRRLTRSVFKSLSRQLGARVDWRNASELLEPRLIGDVLVLPGYAFARSSNKYEAFEGFVPGPELVTHHYAGTWKNEVGGEVG
ncbi:hypothetical protein FQN50_001620 [Emmonsiellopsis sp. PD_5]|nr:hypothetical protein FQN50_001620 [Emmonsiellopsis sp. PD_5]